MTQRIGLLNGTNITYDKDFTAGILATLNQWIIEGLTISWSGASANVIPWKALIECIRTNWEKVMVFFENTANVALDLTWTKKVYIQVNQWKIDDWSSNSEDGTGIASIQTGASYPSSNYIKIASVSSWTITYEWVEIANKNILSKWFWLNKVRYIDPESGNEVLKNTSQVSVVANTNVIITRNAFWNEERIPYSAIKNEIWLAWKYTQSVPIWDDIVATSYIIDSIPVMSANVQNWIAVSSSSDANIASYKAFDWHTVINQWWFHRNPNSVIFMDIEFLQAKVMKNITICGRQASTITWWKLQWSNNSTWTDIYTSWSAVPTTVTTISFTNTIAYKKYRVSSASSLTTGDYWFEKIQLGEDVPSTVPVAMSVIENTKYNTLFTSIAWANQVRIWLRIVAPYTWFKLWLFKTWASVSSASASVLILDASWNTIKTIPWVVWSNYFNLDFDSTVSGTEYRVVLNDTQYWTGGANYPYTPIASYQTYFPYAIWTVYWAWGWTTLTDWSIFTEITIWWWEVVYTNTLWTNIGWSRVKSWVRFSIPYDTTLSVVKTSQLATWSSAMVQLYADDWTTLIAEQKPEISSDTVNFWNITISANTVYRLVVNDSANFNNNNNELALASYQLWFQFCISGTLNWNNSVDPQNIKEIQFGTAKAVKANASSINTAKFDWFIWSWKVKWTLASLNVNEWSLISWFTWLSKDKTYYISWVAWLISTNLWSIKYPVGRAVSATELILTKLESDKFKTIWSVSSFYHYWWMLNIQIQFLNNGAVPPTVQLIGPLTTNVSAPALSWVNTWWSHTISLMLPRWQYTVNVTSWTLSNFSFYN